MIFSSFKDTSVASSNNGSPSSRQRLHKPLKRLNSKNKHASPKLNLNKIQTSRTIATSSQQSTTTTKKDYQNDLANFVALRHKNGDPSNSVLISAIPSQELLWVKDEFEKPLQPLPTTQQSSSIVIDDEIEDGEIVESEITDIVDLLQESFAAVKQSEQFRKQFDLSSPRKPLFYEDRSTSNHGVVPKYTTFGAETSVNDTSDSEVICLDNSQETDDSVIFVSEEEAPKVAALTTPDCLKSPCISNLLHLSKARKVSPKRKMRLQLWKEKKAIEYAEINAAKGKTSKAAKTVQIKPLQPLKPPESTKEVPPKQLESVPEKRIILIDGSNIAMAYTENYGFKKTDKDFSAEGLKIAIDHFEKLGFQVKAIVPEFRVRRDKSSNPVLMNELKVNGKLTLTPSKSYDDRVILESALRLDAAVVSNDHYRDLLQERPEFQAVVSRLIRFNWLFQQLIIPEDPHGRNGPMLNDILYKKVLSKKEEPSMNFP